MLVAISKIAKELNLKPFQLHKWEERGWLGSDPVLKDPDNNGQRIYNESQVERIYFIHQVMQEQKKKGIRRTDMDEMNEKLLEQFGGEVTRIEKEEVMVLPASIEAFQQLIIQQNKQINALTASIEELKQGNRQLAAATDHSSDFDEMKKELKFSKEREDKLLTLVEKLQEDVESLKEQVPKKSRWKSFFGGK